MSGRGWVLMALLVVALGCQTAEKVGEAEGKRKFAVTDYGAVGDGKADDSAAFQKAMDALAAAGKGVLHVPAGDYRIGSRVSVEVTAAGICVMGDGQGVSKLLGDNADGILRIRDEWCKSQVTIRDVSFLATREGAGAAIEVSSPPRGVRNYRTLLVQNVEIRGLGLPTRFYFDYGIKAIAQWRPLFHNVIFSGVLDPALNQDLSDSSPLHKSVCGIQADFCYAPSFQHCYVWNAHTGYRIVSEGRPEGPEDSAFYRSNAVGCRVGIDVSTPIPEPQLVIESCHINCRDVGIRLNKRKFFHITGNLMYGCGRENEFAYTDILLTNSFCGIISGNIFHSPSKDNLKPTPSVDRTMIRVDGKCRDLSITGNIFNAKGVSISVEPGATGITTANNVYPNKQTTVPDEHR